MNRKIILTATIGLAALTSACTPAQVGRLLVSTKHASKPATVVATDTPPVVVIGYPAFPEIPVDPTSQLASAPQCQTGPGPQCVPNPAPADVIPNECGDTQITACPTQVGNAPHLP